MKKKKLKSNPLVKKCWLQNCGTYPRDIFVLIGLNKKEVTKQLKKYTETEELIKELADEDVDKFSGLVMKADNCKIILWLPEYKNEWKYIDILAHEIHHAVFFIAEIHNLKEETEAQAYLYEYLFHAITTKLNR